MAPTCALPVDVPTLPPGALENEPWFMFIQRWRSSGRLALVHFVLIELVLLILVLLIVVVVLLVSAVVHLLLVLLLLLLISRLRLVTTTGGTTLLLLLRFWHRFLSALLRRRRPRDPFATTAERRRRRLVAAGSARPRRWWRLPPLEALAPRRPRELLEIHLALNQTKRRRGRSKIAKPRSNSPLAVDRRYLSAAERCLPHHPSRLRNLASRRRRASSSSRRFRRRSPTFWSWCGVPTVTRFRSRNCFTATFTGCRRLLTRAAAGGRRRRRFRWLRFRIASQYIRHRSLRVAGGPSG